MHKMRGALKLIFVILGSSVLALVVGFVLAGIAASGVIDVRLTHVLFLIAFCVAWIGAGMGAGLSFNSLRKGLVIAASVFVIVGSGLWWLNGWLVQKKAEQDAANHAPVPIKTVPVPTPPLRKTPQSARPQVKIEQHGAASGAVGGSIIQGPCSITQIGGSNNRATTNCGPQQRTLSDQDRRRIQSELSLSPGKARFGAIGADAGSEAYKFAQLLFDIFHDAGWDTGRRYIAPLYNSDPSFGVEICWSKPASPDPNFAVANYAPLSAKVALKALNDGRIKGIKLQPNQDGLATDTILVVVGPNPDN